MKHLILFIVFAIALSMAEAQQNLNLAFRPAANFPMKDLGNTKINKGGGFDATVAYRFIPHFALFGGWGWNRFSEKEPVTGPGNEFEETGYHFGLHFLTPPSAESKLKLVIGGGAVYNHIETENKDGDIIHDTGHGLGWQAEAGISIPVSKHWQLVPAIRYRSLSRDMTLEGNKIALDLNYISIGMAVTWTLWSAD